MFPKLHKNQGLNEIIAPNPLYCIKINKILDIEVRTILTGSAISGLSILIHKIIEPCLKEISHILNYISDFAETTEKYLEIRIALGFADIKSLHTNISHDLVLKTLEYWMGKLQY